MKLKKIVTILLCCLTLLSTDIPVFAIEKSDITSNIAVTSKTGDVKDLKSLCDKYRLEDVSVLPEDIIPLKFNSIQDADNYFSKVESENKAEAEKAAKTEQEN